LQWFKGGKTNICYNAVDRNVEAGDGEKIAMYWEGNEPGQDAKLTYSELLNKVCQVKITRAPIVDTPKHLHVMPPWRRIK
jgi:acyl-coenzyme A synthetase/AMP-(fatty) acid ligase